MPGGGLNLPTLRDAKGDVKWSGSECEKEETVWMCFAPDGMRGWIPIRNCEYFPPFRFHEDGLRRSERAKKALA